MALTVWIGENLDKRHEQEQMKEFLSLMHTFYDNQPASVHVLCNFICAGSQIDAAVVKMDAFIPIEFKTADGPVCGSENGKWKFKDPYTCREIQLGGGSHASNPYNQIANARTAVARKLEENENEFFRPHECERVANWRHFVHGLVVLAPNLDGGPEDNIDVDFYAKPWFYCCRMKDVAEVVSKTTTRDGELSNKNILKIINQVLHLEKAEMRDGVPVLPGIAETEEEVDVGASQSKQRGNFGQTLGDVFSGLDKPESKNPVSSKPSLRKQKSKVSSRVGLKAVSSHVAPTPKPMSPQSPSPPKSASATVVGNMPPISDLQVTNTLNSVRFVCEDLPEHVESNPIVCAKSNATDLPVPIDGEWDYVIELKYKGDAQLALSKVNEYWSCPYTRPYVVGDVIVWRFPEANADCTEHEDVRGVALQGIGFLPPVIEDYITEHPNARYSPDALAASSNLTADAQQAEWYLGTYFPRSFCEVFAIFDHIFAKEHDELEIREKISILDVGIGSGGATYGLIWVLRKWFKDRITEVNVIGFDGNNHALELCGELSCAITSKWKVSLNVGTTNVRIDKAVMDGVTNQKFDFVLASKAIQEMNGSFGYGDFVSLANSVLTPTGIAALLEIFSEARQREIKAALNVRNSNSHLLVASVECPMGSTFGVISNLTTQMMEESVLFAAWGGSNFTTIEEPEIKVECRNPRENR